MGLAEGLERKMVEMDGRVESLFEKQMECLRGVAGRMGEMLGMWRFF